MTPRRPSRARRKALQAEERLSLCETLDRVLNKGVVVVGHLVVSVADVDLLYVGLNVLVSSVETMQRARAGLPAVAPAEVAHALR